MAKVIASGASDDAIVSSLNPQIRRVENNDFTRANAHGAIELALLYVVVEGWRKWDFADPVVDRLLAEPFVAELQSFRHAIFHAKDFDSEAVMQFMEDPTRSGWAADLGNAFRDALRRYHDYLNARRAAAAERQAEFALSPRAV